MSYFKHHAFICCNQRDGGEACCNDFGADKLHKYAKERINELGLKGQGGIRFNKAGCLGRCDEGPVLVVYPEEIWYTFVDKADIDEIITEHLIGGRVVERLRI